ncbi:MAG TPA: flagellar biosynthetic protein FliO [Stellaceae bacterium]|jgi:flagellar protein FliO/FliZ|nr:flagellar biosynthetic protein FliO [Stellaceae bacterium]
MGLDTYLRFLIALVLVVGMIGALAWVVRRFGWANRFVAPAGKKRLAVLEVLPLDGKRRLILLRRDAAEHLILLGTEGDLLIETGIAAERAPASEFHALVEGSQA